MENNKEENKKGFLDSIKSILPGAKKIKELEEQIAKEKADNEAKLLEAEDLFMDHISIHGFRRNNI